MELKNKEYFKKLANQLMFDLSDAEAEDIVAEFELLESQLGLMEKIDTAGVEEMIYPFEDETSFIREDVVDNVITQEQAMSNVVKSKLGHVVVCKVVK